MIKVWTIQTRSRWAGRFLMSPQRNLRHQQSNNQRSQSLKSTRMRKFSLRCRWRKQRPTKSSNLKSPSSLSTAVMRRHISMMMMRTRRMVYTRGTLTTILTCLKQAPLSFQMKLLTLKSYSMKMMMKSVNASSLVMPSTL